MLILIAILTNTLFMFQTIKIFLKLLIVKNETILLFSKPDIEFETNSEMHIYK